MRLQQSYVIGSFHRRLTNHVGFPYSWQNMWGLCSKSSSSLPPMSGNILYQAIKSSNNHFAMIPMITFYDYFRIIIAVSCNQTLQPSLGKSSPMDVACFQD